MSRKTQNTDKQMIKAGKELFAKLGSSGMSIRAVCKHADVNTGMFNYYFKKKSNFIAIVFQEIYEDFFSKINLASSAGKNPKEKLKFALLEISKFVRENKELLKSFLKDVILEDKTIQNLLKDNMPRHLNLLYELTEECIKKGFFRKNLTSSQIFTMVPPVLIFPILFEEAIKIFFESEILFFKNNDNNLSDEILSLRIDILLKGLEA